MGINMRRRYGSLQKKFTGINIGVKKIKKDIDIHKDHVIICMSCRWKRQEEH